MPDNTSASKNNHYEQITKNNLGITKYLAKASCYLQNYVNKATTLSGMTPLVFPNNVLIKQSSMPSILSLRLSNNVNKTNVMTGIMAQCLSWITLFESLVFIFLVVYEANIFSCPTQGLTSIIMILKPILILKVAVKRNHK